MALFRKFFSRKPPDGLLEISERVYVFDCCFTTDVLEEEKFKVYMGGIVSQLQVHFIDSSFMVFNFREGERQSFLSEVLSAYDMTVMDYPWHYEGCPLLTIEMIHHFLRSSESWFSLSHQNILLMHCERGGWPVLAFMLAGLMIYRKQYTGEQKTLDMIYKQAPRELLQLLSPLNPMPSQIRYLQYISRRNVSSIWPPLDRALMLDCVILRFIPNFDGEGGCRPLFRIYGQDPFISEDRTPKVLFSTLKRSKIGQLYRQEDCELVKIDIHCHIQGDVVLECISLDDLKHEVIMFRVMFNTAFIRSNILMLNRDEIDIMWNAKDRFLKNFRAEVLFSELDASSSVKAVELPHIEDKDGLPIETFAKMQEIFSNLVWIDSKGDATLHGLQQLPISNVSKGSQDTVTPQKATTEFMLHKTSHDFLTEKLLRSKSYDVSTISLLTTKQKSVSSPKHSFDSSAMSQNTLLPNMEVFYPTQPKKISKFFESPHMSPVSSTNSLQSSPKHISRYHSAPSSMETLGITALLHDHDVLGRAAHSMTLSLSAPSLFPNETSAMPEPAEMKTASSTTPLSASQPPLLPPPPLPSLQVASHASVPILFPLSPSASLPSSESPLKNDRVTSITPNLFTASTTNVTSISLSTSAQPQSSCLLPSNSQPILSPSSPPLLSPPPPLISSSRKRSFPSLAAQNSTDDTEIAASVPPISIISFPAEGIEYKASSPAETTGFSAVNHKSSSPVKGLSAAAPPPSSPPPLHPSATISSFAPSTNTCVIIPPPHAVSGKYIPSTDFLPPLPPSPPTINEKDSLSADPPPLLPSPSTNNIKGPSTIPLLDAPSYSQSSSYPLSSEVQNTFAPQSPPTLSCCVLPSTLAPPPCHPSQDSGFLNIQKVPPPSAIFKGQSPSSGPPPPPSISGGIKGQNFASSAKKPSLKPLHWVKVTRAVQGSLWAETQKSDEASEAPEFDMSELEGLFSVSNSGDKRGRLSLGKKPERVQLIDLQRANNCEIMLTKVKISLTDLLNSVLALDDTVLDVDQVDNLIKFCPTKGEIELLNNFKGDKERLGKCEQYFLELMKVPRLESKLGVFSFKIKFRSQVADLNENLNIVNSASQEIRSSVLLKRIMLAILSLGNTINQGTARGSAIGFKVDSLLKLNDTRARNNKMTLMHYLCQVLGEKFPELLCFPKDIVSLENASKIQLIALAEELQAISKGLEKVEAELILSENDGPVSEIFCKTLKEFLVGAEAELRGLTSLYSTVGRNADALALYFGEDPAHYPFEQVVNTLLNFVKAFVRAHEENCKELELEKKAQQKIAGSEKMKQNSPNKEGGLTHSPLKCATNR